MISKLHCGTGNAGKLREFQAAAGASIEIHSVGPLNCPETGDTFEGNAGQKALCYGKALAPDEFLFVDDSGIEIDALGGAPGVYSARFAGVDATDEDNNRLMLEKLRDVPKSRRGARYVCVIALVRGSEVLATFRAEAEGRIQDDREGTDGFGYDPYFYFPPTACTFAQLAPAEKWQHSHRGKAFRQMLSWLAKSQ
jgi:XTP/dITP diphosphohydrolase